MTELRKFPSFLWVGGKRASGVSAACCFARFRGGRKTVAGKTTESGRAKVDHSGGMEAEVFRLPQEHGQTHR